MASALYHGCPVVWGVTTGSSHRAKTNTPRSDMMFLDWGPRV